MKKFLIFKICIFTLILSLHNTAFANDWSKSDTYRECIFITLNILDWGTTRDIAKHPESYVENNPIIKGNPSLRKVDNYFLATIVLHPIISYYLPKKQRKTFQYISILIAGTATTHNLNIGLKVNF